MTGSHGQGLYLSRTHLKRIVDHAEAAYPTESCGLLAGRIAGDGRITVSAIHRSRNMIQDRSGDRFEIDPRLLIRLQRAERDGGARIVGVYHSHPDHAAQPSAVDLASAADPSLVWVIVSVEAGQAIQVTAHALDQACTAFTEIPLRTGDWRAPPQGAPSPGSERS